MHRDDCQAEDEARGNNVITVSSGDCSFQRKESDSRCEANDSSSSVGAGVESRPGVRLGGCERTHVTQWTERQRTMCLVPDVGGRSAAAS